MGRLSMHSKCLDFSPFKFWVGGAGLFFIFPLFPTWSLQVPNGFPICFLGSQCIPQGCSQQHLALIPYVLPKVLPFSPIQVGQRGALHLSIESSILGSLYSFNFFFAIGQSNSLIVEQKKGWTLKQPQLINMKKIFKYLRLQRWGVLCKGYQPTPKMVTNSFGKHPWASWPSIISSTFLDLLRELKRKGFAQGGLEHTHIVEFL